MSSFNMGGAEKHALLLADYYKNHLNWETEVWAWYSKTNRVKEICDSINIKTRLIPPFNRFRKNLHLIQINKYAKIFKSAKVDVLMSFNNKPNILSTAIWKKANIKLHVWAQQGIDIHTPVFKSKFEKTILKKNLTCVISNSKNGAEFLQNEHFIPNEIIHVIPNGISHPDLSLSQKWKKRLGLDLHNRKSFNAIIIANLTNLKDHITLIKAWKIVVDELNSNETKANLFLAGRIDNEGNKIFELIQELGLVQNVFCLGQVKDIMGLTNEMDIAILSSPSEGVPNSVIESMILAKPFVGTNIPGIREAVGKKNYKFLSEEKNFNDLADKILLFAKDKDLSKKIGERNRDYVKEKFSIQKLWENTHSIIEKKLS